MPASRLRERFARVLDAAGVTLDGPRAWDVRVKDERVFRRAVWGGLPGLCDAYVDGWWECDALDELFTRALRADLPAAFRWAPPVVRAVVRDLLTNPQSRTRGGRNARAHYDLGDDLFEAMLDRRMMYSCAYWEDAATLDEAQERKLELICTKLGLGPGMRVLDIGCGWGGFAQYAAERHGCSVVGITVSPAQAAAAEERCRGLPVEVRLQDYREVRGPFDRVVSIGMFEHVGQKNHATYMEVVRRALTPDGLALLHFFVTQRSWPNRLDSEVIWVERRIFPGFVTPSPAQVGRALEGGLVVEDLHNIGSHYDPTLMAWHANFEHAWPSLRGPYGEPFFRVWSLYLHLAAAAFRSRKYQVWQLVLSPRGVPGGWTRPRAERGAARVVAAGG